MRAILVLAALTATALPALAHTGAGATSGFAAGLSHPISGLDHVLAIVSVGILAGFLGGRALWLVPLAFLGTMAGGAILAMAGLGLPLVEAMVELSVVVLGAAVALRSPRRSLRRSQGRSLPVAGAMALVAAFAAFHGHAHGAELPATGSALGYGPGFLLATALLLATGVLAGMLASRDGSALARLALRGGGAAASLAGVAILAGAL